MPSNERRKPNYSRRLTWLGVFIVDQSLITVEGYTTDEAKLTAAEQRVAGTATMMTGRERDATS